MKHRFIDATWMAWKLQTHAINRRSNEFASVLTCELHSKTQAKGNEMLMNNTIEPMLVISKCEALVKNNQWTESTEQQLSKRDETYLVQNSSWRSIPNVHHTVSTTWCHLLAICWPIASQQVLFKVVLMSCKYLHTSILQSQQKPHCVETNRIFPSVTLSPSMRIPLSSDGVNGTF